MGQINLQQGFFNPVFNVPVVFQQQKIGFIPLARQDALQGLQNRCYAQCLGYALVLVGRKSLGHHRHFAFPGNGAGSRGQRAGKQFEQGGFTRAIVADKARFSAGNCESQSIEQRRAARKLVGKLVNANVHRIILRRWGNKDQRDDAVIFIGVALRTTMPQIYADGGAEVKLLPLFMSLRRQFAG